MRAIISLLVTSLTFGTLTIGCLAANRLTFLLENGTQHTQMSGVANRGRNSRPKHPRDPAPHRGSGRRELQEFVIITPAV
ncbi:MAG: hypothetical protein HC908_05675 [Calothrix sp. SM1_7_51]|nr:hypothetical protein [Calothrix sp. SM1_7_51]